MASPDLVAGIDRGGSADQNYCSRLDHQTRARPLDQAGGGSNVAMGIRRGRRSARYCQPHVWGVGGGWMGGGIQPPAAVTTVASASLLPPAAHSYWTSQKEGVKKAPKVQTF